MLRVLQVLGTTGLGGAESRIMDLYRHMDRDEIQFDFLVTQGTSDYYSGEIKSLGGKIYYLPAFRVYNYFKYKKACKDFFANHKNEYKAVHGHMTSTAAIYLPIAKSYGVPLTIAHARSAGVDPGLKGKITQLLRCSLYKKCDRLFSCSDEASIVAFGAKLQADDNGGGVCMAHGRSVTFMPNAIDTKEFAFNETVREKIRQEYNISNRIIVGHVGSFRYAKNHEFVLEVFKELHESYKKKGINPPILMLLGDGELKEKIEEKAVSLGIKEDVIFTGNKTPVAPFYQAFDILLFPSFYEGMPGTVVEAQASGLKCLISDRITSQVGVTDLVEFMSLDKSSKAWADKLEEMLHLSIRRDEVFSKEGKPLYKTMFDVNMQKDFYKELYENGN